MKNSNFALCIIRFLVLSLGVGVTGTSYADQNLAGNVTVTGGTSTGNLNVTGSLDVDGPVVSFGTIGTSTVGNSLIFSDSTATSGTTGDTLTFSANRTTASWLWLHNASKSAMRLNSLHQLLLYQADGSTVGITLTPASNQISFGTATLTGSGSTLTAGGSLTVTGALTASSGITNTNGTLTGGASGLTLNNGTSGSNITLSSAGPGDIIFTTNGLERARIKSSGNVGIGTPNPSGVLEISKPSPAVYITDTGSSYAQFALRNNNSSLYFGQETATGGAMLAGSAPLAGIINMANANALQFGTSNVVRMTVSSTGNVGIGTAYPQAKLSVMNASDFYLDYATGGASNGAAFRIGSNSNNSFLGSNFYYGGTTKAARAGGSSQIVFDITGASTGSAGDISFYTAPSVAADASVPFLNAMTIKSSSGNVGIGTTAPGAKLEVKGSYGSTGGGGDLYANSENSVITLDAGNSRLGFVKQYADYPAIAAGSASPLRLGHWNTPNLLGNVSSGIFTPNFVIDIAGNIGVGTTTPRSRLDIGTNLGAGNGARFGDYLEINEREVINNASTLGWNAYIAANDGTFAPSFAPGTGMVLAMSGGGTADLDFWGRNWAGSGTPVNLTSFTHVMRLSTNGNVGIGTTNPTQKLSVAGTVRAYAVVVDTGWSDYVFDKDYRLAPLSEVEQHIKAEKHLPGIPSAAEVAEHGVSLGDMQSKLLAKIEELTLHQIAQEKQLNAQAARIEQLEQDNSALRNR